MMSPKYIVRIAVPLGVAFALVLAGTVPAFAGWGNSTYAAWRDISASMPGESPHGDYDTTSQKCKVCHAVHSAKPGGEKLLRSSTADACTFCHITAKVSDYVVYDGIEGNYSGTDFQNAHNTGVTGGVTGGCADCHSVHAAYSQMTANSALTEKILSGERTDPFQIYYDERAGAPQPIGTDSKVAALSKWCTKCHIAASYYYYATAYEIPGESLQTHIMKAPDANYLLSSGEATRVAYATSEQCSSCHTSNYNDGSRSWPHYTDGARFLVKAQSSASATSPVTPGQTKFDAVCLRCHRDGSRGVGVTY